MPMTRRIAVRGIVVHDGKLLCATPKPYNKNVITGLWGVPGGGIDDGEALIPALERELFEELGISPKIGILLYIQQFTKPSGRENLEFFFHITNAHEFLNLDLSKSTHGEAEIEDIKFVDPAKFPIVPKFLMSESFTNIANQPTKIFNYL